MRFLRFLCGFAPLREIRCILFWIWESHPRSALRRDVCLATGSGKQSSRKGAKAQRRKDANGENRVIEPTEPSKSFTSAAVPEEKAQKKELEEGLPQASGRRKEYPDDHGNVTKVVEWFGFKLHLLVDVKNEVVLSYEITGAKAGDGETLT